MDSKSKYNYLYKKQSSKLAQKREETRSIQRNRRTSNFNLNRKIEVEEKAPIKNKCIDRRQRLEEFKKNKELLRQEEKRQKKPEFKVTRCPTTIVTNLLNSKYKSSKYNYVRSRVDTNLVSRTTNLPTSSTFNPVLNLPKVEKRSNSTILTRGQLRRQNALKNSESFFPVSSVTMRNENLFDVPARVEVNVASKQLPNLSILNVETQINTLKISNEQPVKDGTYFENILNKEIIRLENQCKHWEQIQTSSCTIPDEISGEISCAIGQTRLLIKQKFEQFRSLTHKERNGDPKVKPDDLQGFWDMIYMQVENVDKKFTHLEELKSKNWLEKQPLSTISVSEQGARNNAVCERQPTLLRKQISKVGPSVGFRTAIAEARKRHRELMEQQKLKEGNLITFDAGFFQVHSPCKMGIVKQSPKNVHLKTPNVSSPAIRSPSLCMLRVSQMVKADLEEKENLTTGEDLLSSTTPVRRSQRITQKKL